MEKTGTFLHVDLTGGTVTPFSIPENLTRLFLGGRGLAAALACRLIPRGCDPLGPENRLVICTGLLTGTPAPSSARTHFCALSPLTGILGSSNAGGFFGADLRACGFAGIVISGASPGPVGLWIDSAGAHLRPADDLWGADALVCRQRIEKKLPGVRLRVLSIGPAGENRSAMACILSGTHSAAGRTGLGAVMGAKHLKAVVVNGAHGKIPSAPDVKKAVADYIKPLSRHEMFKTLGRYGQSGYIGWCSDMGMLSTFNYQQGTFDEAGAICGSRMQDRVVGRRACYRCPVRCKADTVAASGPHRGETGPRPEFESIAALGAKCGQTDMDAVLHLSNLCNRLGLDTISAGSSIAFAMELYQRRIIDERDTGGMALLWGDLQTQELLLRQMAERNGFGAVLADGVRAAADRIGRGSRRFAFHSKGLELCAYDPRGSMSTALGYAVSGRGGDYAAVFASAEYRWDEDTALQRTGDRRGADRFSPGAKAAIVRLCSICSAVVDSLGLCKVVALGISAAFDLESEAALLRALFDREMTAGALWTIGERIVNLERWFNLRHGAEQGDLDTLPHRFFTEPMPEGRARGRRVDLRSMLADYYRQMDWDRQGGPRPEKLKALGLADFLNQPQSFIDSCRIAEVQA